MSRFVRLVQVFSGNVRLGNVTSRYVWLGHISTSSC